MKINYAPLIAVIGLAVVLAACGSTASSPGATASPSGAAPAGPVTFNVTNAGTMDHEFVILKTDTLAEDLPLDDGVVVEDDFSPVGEVPETAAGKSGIFSTTLAAGHYAIICNILGHVSQGMVIDFTVN